MVDVAKHKKNGQNLIHRIHQVCVFGVPEEENEQRRHATIPYGDCNVAWIAGVYKHRITESMYVRNTFVNASPHSLLSIGNVTC